MNNEEILQPVKSKRGRKKGYKHSLETRLKMSNSRKGFHMSDDTKQKISDARTGTHHSEETIQKIINTKHNHPIGISARASISRHATERMKNPEFRRIISEAIKKYHLSKGHVIHKGV